METNIEIVYLRGNLEKAIDESICLCILNSSEMTDFIVSKNLELNSYSATHFASVERQLKTPSICAPST